jgi:Leucine-rich repeat (LRR) protein
MNISNHSRVSSPLTSTSSIDHTRQIITLGITERIVLLCNTIFQSSLNLCFNYIDKTQLQRQWRQIYTGQQEVSLSPVVQNLSEMQPELATFCHLFSNSNQEELNASDQGLQTLPESIGNLVNLTSLELSWNRLQTLPESIGNLGNLTELRLDFNRLQTLPESIGNLVNLTDLKLFFNVFQTLPESIGNLVNLTDLSLGFNELQALPESIGNLVNLTELSLGFNRLQSLPESVGNLVNLKYLRLSNNHFSSVPECLFRLSKHCTINLENNRLSEEEIARLRQRINQPGYQGPQFIVVVYKSWLQQLSTRIFDLIFPSRIQHQRSNGLES